MRKIFYTLLGLILSGTLAFCADMSFVQVDGLRFNPNDQDSVNQFENLIKKINNQKNASFVIFTGNNISKPDSVYLKKMLRSSKKIKKPCYFVLGTKDINKKKGLSKTQYVEILQKNIKSHKKIKMPNYIFEKNGVVFIVADGSKEVIPTSQGYYRPNVLEWLDVELNKYADKNVVIIQHYPLIPPIKKETYYTYKADDYLKMLSKHQNVKAVIAGHFNANDEQRVDGVIHISTPEVPKYKIIDVLDYETTSPTFWSTVKE